MYWFTLIVCLPLLANDDLYLLQASPLKAFAKTKLWSKPGGGSLAMRQRVVRDGVGIGQVSYDDEARLIVFASPDLAPRSVEVIAMDTPQVRKTIPIEYECRKAIESRLGLG